MSAKKHQQNLYRQLFEQSEDAHLIIQDNHFVDCNAATVRMLGYENKQQVLDTHPAELSPPTQPDGRKSVEKADDMMAIALRKGSHRFIWDHRRANGEIIPVEVLLTALESDDGQPLIHTVWRDITARQENQARFQALFENMNDGFALHEIVLDEKGTPVDYIFREINAAFEAQTGLSRGDLIDCRVTEALPGTQSDPADWIATYGRIAMGGGEERFEQYSESLDRWFSVVAYSPKPGFFATLITDITERRHWLKLQHALSGLSSDLLMPLEVEELGRIAGMHLREFFSSEAISIWYHDFAEEVARSIYLEDTPVGEQEPKEYPAEVNPFSVYVAGDIFSMPMAELDNRTSEQLAENERDLPFGSVDRMSASMMFMPILWEGKKIGVISLHSYTLNYYNETHLEQLGLFADIIGVALQRALTKSQLRINQEELRKSVAEKDVLLREIQHRTKNNMNIIIALMRMQAQEVGNDELHEAFQVTRDRIHAMSLVYDQLQKSSNFTAIDLQVYIQQLVQNLRQSIVHDSARVKIEIECDSIPITLIQAVPVGIILNEVITNAMKHAFPDQRAGRILVSAIRAEENRICIQVSDDGVGLDHDELDKVQESLGMRLVNMLAVDQLSGDYRIETSNGVMQSICFDLISTE